MEILTYAKENRLQFYCFAYEKGINELVIDTFDDYITQIEIPIKTQQHSILFFEFFDGFYGTYEVL